MEKNYKYVAANGSIYYLEVKVTVQRTSLSPSQRMAGRILIILEKMERLIRAGTLSKEKNIISTAERVLAQEYVRRT